MASKGRLRTGGYLNTLSRKRQLGRRGLTINTIRLVSHHRPRSEKEMVRLLEDHKAGCPECGEVTNGGGLPGWTKLLHQALIDERENIPPGSEALMLGVPDCGEFIYDLYVRAPIRGEMMERKALTDLNGLVSEPGRNATPEEDLDYNIDLVFPGVAVQVKPFSFEKRCKQEPAIRAACEKRNKLWGLPVVYLYYNNDLEWTNLGDVALTVQREIEALAAAAAPESPPPASVGAAPATGAETH